MKYTLEEKIFRILQNEGISVLDAIVFYGDEKGIKMEDLAKRLPKKIIDMIEEEANKRNLLKK